MLLSIKSISSSNNVIQINCMAAFNLRLAFAAYKRFYLLQFTIDSCKDCSIYHAYTFYHVSHNEERCTVMYVHTTSVDSFILLLMPKMTGCKCTTVNFSKNWNTAKLAYTILELWGKETWKISNWKSTVLLTVTIWIMTTAATNYSTCNDQL